MVEPRRIFISHNSKSDPVARAFLNNLVSLIEAEKSAAGDPLFDVLVDKDLTPGERWRGPLYTWMLLCDTAVLLLDANTIDSMWVPREAMIFSWRLQLDTKFRLLPIFRGVDKTIFQKPPFTEMGLEELGHIATDDPAKILEALKLYTSPSPDRRFKQLEDYLRATDANAYKSSFDDAQSFLALAPEWSFLKTFRPGQAIAAALLGLGFWKGPCRDEGTPYPSAWALDALSRWLDTKSLRQIYDLLSSYWVARDVGADLYRALRQPTVIAARLHIADQDQWTQRFVAAHFREAYSQDPRQSLKVLRLPPLLAGNGMDDEVTSIEKGMRDAHWAYTYPGRPWTGRGEQPLPKVFVDTSTPPFWFFWVVDHDPVHLDSLVEVQRKIPGVRLIYLSTGDPAPEHDGVYWLNTRLDPGAEQTILDDTEAVDGILAEALR